MVSIFQALTIFAITLLAASETVIAARGSSGGGSRGGSSSGRGSSSSRVSSSSSASRSSSSYSGRYSGYSGATSRVVAITSPVVYRPVYTSYYRPYYYSSSSVHNYSPSRGDVGDTITTEQTVYANLPEHCQAAQSYGISLNERYLIFGRSSTSQNGTVAATVATCRFTIVGPKYTQLSIRLDSNGGNCTFWPNDCTIEIWEYPEENSSATFPLLHWAKENAGNCPTQLVSEFDALAVTIKSCDPVDYPDFNFVLSIENGAIIGRSHQMTIVITFLANIFLFAS